MKVIITDYEYEHVEKERAILQEAGFVLADYQYRNNPEALLEVCRDADAVITQYAEITREIIAQMTNCKIIIKYGIGVNNIDVDAATEKGIFVCNSPDYGVDEVSNHAIAMMFALIKKLPVIQGALRQGQWGNQSLVPLYRLAGQTLGLVGLGRIPSLVARKMAGFGVNIVAYDPFVPEEVAKDMGVTLVDFETLYKTADIVSVHCPLLPSTTHLFNKEVFAGMKSTAVIVNTARGPIIDEAALVEALETGEIAGAGLDVFEVEPVANDNPLLHMPQAICTPHVAWYSQEAIDNLQRGVAKEVVNTLQSNKPWNAVNGRQLCK